jgi:hypothetical protein
MKLNLLLIGLPVTGLLYACANPAPVTSDPQAAPPTVIMLTATPSSDNAGTDYPQTRDPRMWPFARESIWNMPIGSAAVYVPADFGPAKYTLGDPDWFIVTRASDPWRPLFVPGAWGPGRCTGQLQLGEIPFPDDLIAPDATTNSTPNNATAILLPDGRTLMQLEPLARCEVGGRVYGYRATEVDLYGPGIYGGHFGSGLSSIGGTLRKGELLPESGPIRHALKINVWAAKYVYYADAVPGYRWPAITSDTGANDPTSMNRYGGSNPRVLMGSLLAIPPGVTETQLGLKTEVGRKLFHALQDYGAYIADNAGWDAHYFTIETGVDEECLRAYGVFFGDGAMRADINQLFQALHIVDNNGPESIGGGGEPRVPLAPDFIAPAPPDLPQLVPHNWIATAFAQAGVDGVANAVDGDPATTWRSGVPIAEGQAFILDLGTAQTFTRVVMDAGVNWHDWPQNYTLAASLDGNTWTIIAIGSGAPVTQVTFKPQTARYLKISARPGQTNPRTWSLAEVKLYGPASP